MAHEADVQLIRDSEETALSLDAPEIEDARGLFTLEDPVINRSRDIVDIILSCIKDVKKSKQLNHTRMIKLLTQLTAVSEYVKLRTVYKLGKACKQPCLKASVAIAHRMGKGLHFARQICHLELHLLKHHQLPPRKGYTWNGQYSVLDNEAVLHGVRVYLTAQSLGTVTPLLLSQHVNDTLLPVLKIQGTICESTAR